MILKQHYCKDHYRYICTGVTCKHSSSIKKFMSTYCPTTIPLDVYARIVFEYFVDGINTKAL